MTDLHTGGWNPGDMPETTTPVAGPEAGPFSATFSAQRASRLPRATAPKGVIAGLVVLVAVGAVALAATSGRSAGPIHAVATTTPPVPRISMPPTTVYSPATTVASAANQGPVTAPMTAPAIPAGTTSTSPATAPSPVPAPAPAPATTAPPAAPAATTPPAPVVIPAPATTVPSVPRHTITYLTSGYTSLADLSYISTDWGTLVHVVASPYQRITSSLQSGARYSVVASAQAGKVIVCSVFDDNTLIAQKSANAAGVATCTGIVP